MDTKNGFRGKCSRFLSEILSSQKSQRPWCVMTRGITLVELILSISIIGMFSTLAIVNFRSSKQDNILRIAGFRTADAVRAAQSYALAGVPQNADPAVAAAQVFGVYIKKTSEQTGEAILFADTDTASGTGIYDTGKDTELRTVSLDADSKKTVIPDSMTLDGASAQLPLTVAFKKPDASGLINGKNGSTDPKEIVLTFKHTQSGHTKTVTINRVAGRVDAQY